MSSTLDAFICHKSEDGRLASEVYDLLTSAGATVFLSSRSLSDMSTTDYQRAIDQALENAKHLVVVASTPAFLTTPYVESEWRMFVGEKRSGRKQGNVVTVYGPGVRIPDLPLGLRYYEAIAWEEGNKDRLTRFILPAHPRVTRKSSYGKRSHIISSLGMVFLQVGEGTPLVASAPVTNRQYEVFVKEGKGTPPGKDPEAPSLRAWGEDSVPAAIADHPVVNVSVHQAVQFARWLTERDRANGAIRGVEYYGLPTFDEWRRYARGAEPDVRSVVCNRHWGEGRLQPTEHAYFGFPSRDGLFCVFGNVFEWCSDKNDRLPGAGLTVSGGWASSLEWIQKGNVGIWRAGGEAMKDGGFRLCLRRDQEPTNKHGSSLLSSILGRS